jgi:hypothetical protein
VVGPVLIVYCLPRLHVVDPVLIVYCLPRLHVVDPVLIVYRQILFEKSSFWS